MTEDSKATVITFVGAIVVTVVPVVLGENFSTEFKQVAVSALIVEGALLLLWLFGVPQLVRTRRETRRRETKLQRHPQLIWDLVRLHARFNKVTVDRNSSYPSLNLTGEEVLEGIGGAGARAEFSEKLRMLDFSMRALKDRMEKLEEARRADRVPELKPLEFVGLVRELQYLIGVALIVTETVRRLSMSSNSSHTEREQMAWEGFRGDFNSFLASWRDLEERISTELGYVSASNFAMVGSLASTDRLSQKNIVK